MRILRGALKALGAALGPRELALLAGLGLLAFGASLVWPPAAYLLPGAILTYVAVRGLS